MSGTKLAIGMIAAPLGIPIYILAQAGPRQIIDALLALSITDAITVLSVPAGAALTIFILGRKFQHWLTTDRETHQRLETRIVEAHRIMAVSDARTRGRFGILFRRADPPIGIAEVEEAEAEEVTRIESDFRGSGL